MANGNKTTETKSDNSKIYKSIITCIIMIAVLLLVYFIIFVPSINSIRNKNNEIKYNDSITILTVKGEMQLDPNIFNMHLSRFKDKIIKFQSNFNNKNCGILKKYLDKAKINLKEYINTNQTEYSSLCELNNFNLFNDKMIKEKEMLKNKLSSIYEDSEEKESDKIKYELMELIFDIDIILFMIRSSLCKKGKIDLSALDQVVLELYRTNCGEYDSSIEYDDSSKDLELLNENFIGGDGHFKPHKGMDFDDSPICKSSKCWDYKGFDLSDYSNVNPCGKTKCGINTPSPKYGKWPNNYSNRNVDRMLGVKPIDIRRCHLSQSIPDNEVNLIKENLKRQTQDRNNSSMISHTNPLEFDCNPTKPGKLLGYSKSWKNALEWNRQYDLPENEMTEKDCKTCLAY